MAAELLLGEPLFPGDSGVDQLVEIIKASVTKVETSRRKQKSFLRYKSRGKRYKSRNKSSEAKVFAQRQGRLLFVACLCFAGGWNGQGRVSWVVDGGGGETLRKGDRLHVSMIHIAQRKRHSWT